MMMYENLHRDMLKAINEARKVELHSVVVTLQNAICCISNLQKDSELLNSLQDRFNGPKRNSKIISTRGVND